MKILLLAFTLLTSGLALAQTAPAAAPAAGSIQALDEKNGYRKYKFGTPLSELPDMQKRGNHYINPFDIQQIEGQDLDAFTYFYFFEGKLCGVEFSSTSSAQPTPMFALLVKQYGPPQVIGDSKWLWAGQQVTMTYTQQMVTANTRYVGIPIKRGTVVIETNEAAARRLAGVKKKNKLYGTDL